MSEESPEITLTASVEHFFREILPHVPGFQPRDAQLQMALAVARAIENGDRLTVEAGTGTGKSLAYLVPLLLHHSEDEAPSVVATKTLQLQYQLLKKDLPALQKLLPVPRKVVQAKGWSNYVCIRKVEAPDEQSLRSIGPHLGRISQLLKARSGKLTRQETPLTHSQWDRVKADPHDCQKRHCPHFGSCGLFAERRELESAELVVTNHAFLLTDLRLRREGRALLPDGEVLVVDEAHRLDDVATEHLAVRLDEDRIFSVVSSPLQSGSDGWLAATRFTFLMSLPESDFQEWSERFDGTVLLGLKDLESLASEVLLQIQGVLIADTAPRMNLKTLLHSDLGEPLANVCSEMCLACESVAQSMLGLCREYEETFHQPPPPELLRLAQSVDRFFADLQFLLECDSPDWVYLLESNPPSIIARPVDNSEALRTELFGDFSSVITTSASLQVSGSFHFFKRKVGLEMESPEFAFPSPFQVLQNTFIGLADGGPEPNSRDYVNHLTPHLVALAGGLGGRTFLLTTSHARVQEFSQALRGPLSQLGIAVLSQGQGSPAQLLKSFSERGRSVLVGVDTFWEGVDIPGEELSCVVMTRLPFPVPTDVLFSARARRIEEEGGRAFDDLSLPLVGLKMKQGFGRLLRTERDRGIFLLTDPRINTKSYGRRLKKDLPTSHAVTADIQELTTQALLWSTTHLQLDHPERVGEYR